MPDPIAQRTFTIGPDGPGEIEVRLYAPVEQTEEPHDWFCPFEIVEDGEVVKSMRIWGVDSWQALTLALKTVGVVLLTSDYAKNRQLYRYRDNENLGLLSLD
jgi:hypothetical protein